MIRLGSIQNSAYKRLLLSNNRLICFPNISTQAIRTLNWTKKSLNAKEKHGKINSHNHVHQTDIIDENNKKTKLKSELGALSKSHTHSPSHTHSHAGGNPLLILSSEQIKKNPGVRITWIGLGINVGMALGKFVGGLVFHSQALIADSVHALSDLISDFLTLLSVGYSSSKPSDEYPYGYGKVETVGSLAVSTILAMAGLSIGWASLCAIVGPIIPHTIIESLSSIIGHSHSHSHSAVDDITNINAAWIAAGSIVAKEWIFQATKKIAIQTKSNVLMANAWHHRVDSLTSLVALVTITSGYMFNIQSLDAVGGLIVSGLVIKAGTEGMLGSVKELIDRSLSHVDPRYTDIENHILKSLNELISKNNAEKPYDIKSLIILSSGPNLRLQVILEVPLQKWSNILDLSEFENVTEYLRSSLQEKFPDLKKIDIEFQEEKKVASKETDIISFKEEKDVSSSYSDSHFHLHTQEKSDTNHKH